MVKKNGDAISDDFEQFNFGGSLMWTENEIVIGIVTAVDKQPSKFGGDSYTLMITLDNGSMIKRFANGNLLGFAKLGDAIIGSRFKISYKGKTGKSKNGNAMHWYEVQKAVTQVPF